MIVCVNAFRVLIRSEEDGMLSEELIPYRRSLVEAGLAQSLALVSDLEADPRAEIQRLDAFEVLARIQLETGDATGAVATTRKAIALAEDLVARDPTDPRARNRMAASLQRASTILPDDEERRAAARRSTEIQLSISVGTVGIDHGDSLGLTAMNHYNTGHELWMKGRQPQALAAFLAARAAIDEALARGNRHPGTRALAGRIELYLCRAFGLERDAESLAAGRRAESIFRELIPEHPDQFQYA
jgi:hypothetical protein